MISCKNMLYGKVLLAICLFLASGVVSAQTVDTVCVTTIEGAVDGEYCLELIAGQNQVAGSVCATIVDVEQEDQSIAEAIEICYVTTNGWELVEAQLWVGKDLGLVPKNKSGNPQIGHFPYKSGDITGQTVWCYQILLSDLEFDPCTVDGAEQLCYIAAHASLRKPKADGSFETQTGWSAGSRFVAKGSWATYSSINLVCDCKEDKDNEDEEPACETAFAYSEDGTCFLSFLDDKGDKMFNRWGWTLGPLAEGEYEFEIYAAAGQCDLSKGALVGTLSVVYSAGTVTVSYNMEDGFTMDETHLYVGNDNLPTFNGKPTVAPGQYGNIHDLTEASDDEYTIDGLSGEIYIIAHAVVCSTDW